MDLFGEDSEGDDIPCGQQENMACLSQLADQLGSQGHGWEEFLPPPILTPAIQPQPQPAPSVPPVLDIAALVAALKEVTPPPPPPQPEMTQSLLAITQSLAAISQKLEKPAVPDQGLPLSLRRGTRLPRLRDFTAVRALSRLPGRGLAGRHRHPYLRVSFLTNRRTRRMISYLIT